MQTDNKAPARPSPTNRWIEALCTFFQIISEISGRICELPETSTSFEQSLPLTGPGPSYPLAPFLGDLSLFPSLPPLIRSMTNITHLQLVLLIPPMVTLNLNNTHLFALKIYFVKSSLKAKYSHPLGASPRCFSSRSVSSQMTALFVGVTQKCSRLLKSLKNYLSLWAASCGGHGLQIELLLVVQKMGKVFEKTGSTCQCVT